MKDQNNANFINECSLRINKKKYFNFNVESQRGPTILDELINDKKLINTSKLWETCIIPIDNKIENFYNGSMKYKNTPIITTLEIIIDILSKKLHLRCRTTS